MGCLVLKLNQKLINPFVNEGHFTAGIFKFFHELGLSSRQIGNPVVQANQNINNSEESFLGGFVKLRELHIAVENLQLSDLFADS